MFDLFKKREKSSQISDQFPLLKQQNVIYLDNACVTLRPQEVIDAITAYYTDYSSCSGRSNHRLAKKLTQELQNARRTVQNFVGAKYAEEIIFTRNATEGINLVASSLRWESNDVIIMGEKEHNSNFLPWLRIAQKKSITYEPLDLSRADILEQRLQQLERLGKRPRIVAFAQRSNLDGTCIDVASVVAIARKHNCLVLVDAAQTAGHDKIDVQDWDIDFLVCSAHKFFGPSGMGVLYVRKKQLDTMPPFLLGGNTVISSTYGSYELDESPNKYEAGLQDYAGIMGTAAAVKFIERIGYDTIRSKTALLNKYITESLEHELSTGKIILLGPKNHALRGGIFSFYVPDKDAHEIALLLDSMHNIAVRSGHHCVHAYCQAKKIPPTVRASCHVYNSQQDAERFVTALRSVLKTIGA